MVNKTPSLTVFYDRDCPLCNRTVLTIEHFDIFKCIDFKNAQDYAQRYPGLASLEQSTLLTDLYALDAHGRLYAGVDTYIQICLHMRTMAWLGGLLSLPGVKTYAVKRYRQIADNRSRVPCNTSCVLEKPEGLEKTFYDMFFVDFVAQKPKAASRILTKLLVVMLLFQLNSTIHYGLIYRFDIETRHNPITSYLTDASNSLLEISQLFLGIAPHALYLHDHFSGYDRILALTYTNQNGEEQWLPFVNEQGRLLAPNWGRVHSMWANIAVTPTINQVRLQKFIMKVTAFYGHQLGLNLNNTEFHIKLKKIDAPNDWVYDQLHKNFTAPWTTIGHARWTHNVITFDLPNNINSL